MAVDLAALKTEIQTDPTGIYGSVSPGHTQGFADAINERKVSIQMDNFVSAFQIVEAVVPGEYPSVGADQFKRDMWRDIIVSVTGGERGTINANATNLKAKVLTIFAVGTTRTNLAALQTRDGSRAEQLFGLNTTITHKDVGLALGS